MIAAVLNAVLFVVSAVYRLARIIVVRFGWPRTLAGLVAIWLFIAIGPKRIGLSFGKALRLGLTGLGHGLWATGKTVVWTMRYALALIVLVPTILFAIGVLSFCYPTFGWAFGIPALIMFITIIVATGGAALVAFWR